MFGFELFTLPFGETTIGRDDNCSITIDDGSVSRQHAIFDVRETSVVLRDTGSLNGTRVNGVRLDGPCVLTDNDRIRLGPREIVFMSAPLRGRAAYESK